MTATWTTPRTWSDAELVTATLMNSHVRDNEDYLLTPNRIYVKSTSSTDFTSTSASYVAIDASLSVALTTHGGHVLVGAMFNVDISSPSSTFYIAIDVDGTQHCAFFPKTNQAAGTPTGTGTNFVSVLLPSSVVAAGAHTVSLKWKNADGYTMKLYNDAPNMFFWAVEI